MGGPAEAARARRRVDGERPGGQVGDDGRRPGDEADGGRAVSGHGGDAGQERPRPAGQLLPPPGVGERGRDEGGRVVHELLDGVRDAAVGGEQLQRLEHGPERGGRRRRHGRGRLGDDPLRGERQQEAGLRGDRLGAGGHVPALAGDVEGAPVEESQPGAGHGGRAASAGDHDVRGQRAQTVLARPGRAAERIGAAGQPALPRARRAAGPAPPDRWPP